MISKKRVHCIRVVSGWVDKFIKVIIIPDQLKNLEDIIERDRLAISCMMRSLGGRTDPSGNKTSEEMDF